MRSERLSIFGARVNAVALAASLVCFARAGTTLGEPQKAPIQITADLSDAARKLYHAEVDLPVSAGPVTLTGTRDTGARP
jgi:small neutral amino acid transporter SnatA (MarC family)